MWQLLLMHFWPDTDGTLAILTIADSVTNGTCIVLLAKGRACY